MTSDAAAALKAQGDEEFRGGHFLQAAATYSKALKHDPDNAVVYSNRSAALLKLRKDTKAMHDAEAAIRLRPDWDKGFFRKGAVLEAEDKLADAVESYQRALSLKPSNKELSARVASLQRRLKGSKGFFGPCPAKSKPTDTPAQDHAPATDQAAQADPTTAAPGDKQSGAAPAAGTPQSSAQPPAPGKPVATQGHVKEDLGSPEVASFVQDWMEHLAAEVQSGDALTPVVHYLPGAEAGSFDEQQCHVRAAAAFESPDTVASFVDYARGVGSTLEARAVLSVVPKSAVAFPQCWKTAGWPCGDGDGVLVQLEVMRPERMLKLWFVPVDVMAKTVAAPWSGLDPEQFAVLPTLLR